MKFYFREKLLTPYSQNAKSLFSSWSRGIRTICVTGGRSKGNTIAVLLYLLMLSDLVTGLKVVIARSEYTTIKETIIETLADWIFTYPLGDSRSKHPKNPFRLIGGVDTPKVLRSDNGSAWRFVGLQDKKNRSGTECDIFWLNEGQREKTDEVWGVMGGTLAGGRKGNWWVNGYRFSQMIADANPSAKFHWLYQYFHNEDDSLKNKETQLWLPFTHHDNPALTHPNGTLNADGERTQEDLLAFYPPGFEQQRMIWGEWVAAGGLVYSMYQPSVHEEEMSIADFSVDSNWIMGIDHGGTSSPFATGLTNVHNAEFKRFKEFGMSHCTIEDVIGKTDGLLERYSIPKSKIQRMFADTNVPGFNKALREAGYPVVEADKDVVAGVDEVKTVLGDNRLKINKTSMEFGADRYKGPQGFKQEVLGYVYPEEDEQKARRQIDVPEDGNDHWMDETRYELYGMRTHKQKYRVRGRRIERKRPEVFI